MINLINEIIKNRVLYIFWLLFLFALSFVSIFTTNIPYTLSSLIHYLFSFLLFILMLITINSLKSQRILIYFIIGISLVFLSISAYFYFQPQQAKLLPFDNMFYPTFGHNHLAEWLLLVLPLSWWLAIEKQNRILYVLPIILTLGIWFSYGRIVTSLGLLELLAIAWLYRTRWKSQISRGIKMILGFLFIGFVGVLIPGLIVSTTNSNVCNHFHLKKMLCKTTELTSRTYYWQQAVAIWKEKPIFGTGLGTFYNQSLRYVQTPGFQSDYAHNIVLQLLAETGLVGTIPFVLLFSYLLIRVTKKAINANSTLAFMLLIAVYASYINALLDFSWSYNSIFYLTLVLIAVLFSLDRQSNSQVSIKYTQPSGIVTMFTITCGVIAGMIAGSYLLITVVTSIQLTAYPDQIPNTYMKYLKQYKKEYAKLAIAKSEDEKKELFRLYGTDQDVLRELLLSANSDIETNVYQRQMFALDPWYALAFFDAESYLKNNSVDQAVEQVDVLIDFIDQKKDQYKYIPRYETETKFANSVLIIADELFKRGEYQKSAEHYLFAQKIDPWITSKHKPVIEISKVAIEQVDFIRTIVPIDVAYYGEYQAVYGNFALDLFRLTFEAEKYADSEDLLTITIQFLPWNKWKIWDEVLEKVLVKMDDYETNRVIVFLEFLLDPNQGEITEYSDYELREQITKKIQERAVATARENNIVATLQSIRVMQKLLSDDYWASTQLGNYYVLIGELDKAQQAFDVCLKQFNNHHDDCAGAKQAILDGNPNEDRFFQVSQIILGEKRWQDFQ